MVTWGVGPNSTPTGISLSTTGKQLWENGITLANDNKATIVRIRGSVQFGLLTATAAGDGFHGAIGLGIVQADAFAAGAASSPGALTDADWDGWMWHSFFDIHAQVATIAAGGLEQTGVRIAIDTKAMRKIEDAEVLLGSLDIVEIGTATAFFHADTRILFKLS